MGSQSQSQLLFRNLLLVFFKCVTEKNPYFLIACVYCLLTGRNEKKNLDKIAAELLQAKVLFDCLTIGLLFIQTVQTF